MQNKVPHNLKSDPPPPPNFTAKISVVVVFFFLYFSNLGLKAVTWRQGVISRDRHLTITCGACNKKQKTNRHHF